MKVECIKFTEPGDKNCFTIGKEYLVLEISISPEGTMFRIICDFGTPILCAIDKFAITKQNISKSWVVESSGVGYLSMCPSKWVDDSLWQYSFWEDYFGDDDARAKQVFQEEVQKMIEESERIR